MKRKMLFMVTAIALLVAACSTESSKVLPKKPVITDQPSDNQYSKGNEVVPLTVTAETRDKKAKLSYQWYSNTKNSNKNGTRIDGATGALTSKQVGGEYTPPIDLSEDVDEEVYYYYYVEVTSTLGKEKAKTASDVAIIKIVPDKEVPKVTASNSEGETETGDDILLIVQLPDSIEEIIVSGEAEVFYQWYDNGTRNSNVGGERIEGATEDSYMPPTEIEGTRYYYVVVTVKDKETGEVLKTMTSNPMRVTVVVNTTIIDPTKENARRPLIREPIEGSSMLCYIGVEADPLKVTATVSDNGLLTYQWYSNTEDNTTGGERIIGAREATYIPPTDEVGIVYYYAVVTNTIEDNQDGGQKTAQSTSYTVKVEVRKGIDAETPVITTPPTSALYELFVQANPLTVEASVTDGGTLSYQWYKKLEPTNISGELITGANTKNYVPPTNVKVLVYYYVEITNTLEDNGDGGNKTASVKSDPVYIGTAIAPVYLAGVTAANKTYNGNTDATINGTPTGIPANVTLVKGTGQFAQANVGTAIPVTLVGWYLDGPNKGDYYLYLPTNLTANINRAAGTTVVDVPVKSVVTHNSITVSPVVLTNPAEQVPEYAINTANNITAANLTWVDNLTFNGLNAATNYYVYARAKLSENYNAGALKVSVVITTEQPLVTFVTNNRENGENSIDPVTVYKNLKLTAPADPIRDGFTFDYWYSDVNLTTPYNFDAAVTNNLTLYAQWIANSEIVAMKNKDMPMEWVRGGWFWMGSPDGEYGKHSTNEAQHRVILSGFWMNKYEVTQEKYVAIMQIANPSSFQTAVANEDDTPSKLPVDGVSFFDALVFCNKLSIAEGLSPAYQIANSSTGAMTTYPQEWGTVTTASSGTVFTRWNGVKIVANSTGYRLPTDAQWEYACRAGTTTAYASGNDLNTNIGWYAGNSASKTHKVGQKPTAVPGSFGGNNWGLYDMHGNIQEWCWDNFVGALGSGTVINPTGSTTAGARVLRGGSWALNNSTSSNGTVTAPLRSAYRTSNTPSVRNPGYYGFRVVRPVLK